MLFEVRIQVPDRGNPQAEAAQTALIARGFLRGIIAQNQLILRTARQRGKPLPPLYSSGVLYRPEPRRAGPQGEQIQELVDINTVLQRGWGDCKHLTAWRVAELREQGERADITIYWRKGPDGIPRIFHAEVRREPTAEYPKGEREDVSRYLGMAS